LDPHRHQIAGTGFHYRDHGAYATVFADPALGRVRRVFRKRPDAGRDHCAAVFAAEIEAYRLIKDEPDLRAVTPAYFGVPTVAQIVDADGTDVSAGYWLDLAMELELIPHPFRKLGSAPGLLSAEIRDAFRAIGVRHLSDVSVAIVPAGRICLIDFAAHEEELWHQD
jgi:hypothetical protein